MGEKNLLLLSMSVLRYYTECYYEGDYGETGYFRGVSQLEAGTKFYLRKLLEDGKKIDNILIIESPETSEKTIKTKDISKFLQKPTHFLSDTSGTGNTSAVEFYKERILQYIKGREKTWIPEVKSELTDQVDQYEKEEETLLYLYPDVDHLFVDVPIEEDLENGEGDDEKALFKCINKLCSDIQGFGAYGSKIKLYLYMQGAPRYETFIINAAINMLKMRNINVESSIAINFDSNNNKNGKFNRIVDTTFNDRVFEMVSGMNQFITTGRGDTLTKFCKDSENLVDLKRERGIVDVIQNISTALSLCDVEKFDKEIKELKNVLEKYDKEKSTNLLFKTFVEDLRKDYDESRLFDEDSSPTVNQAGWCLKKGLYQQALTLLESKIPKDIVNNKIIYYGDKNELLSMLNTIINIKNLHGDEKLKGKINPNQAEYILIHCALGSKEASDNENPDNQPRAYTWDLNKYNLIDNDKDSLVEYQRKDSVQKRDNIRIGKLIKKYREICDMRNNINHANGKISVIQVENEVNDFIQYYKKLIKDNVSVDLSKQFSVKKQRQDKDSLTQTMSFNGVDLGNLPKS